MRGYRLGVVAAGAVLVAGLFVPDPMAGPAPPAESNPFRWDRAALFTRLEEDFQATRLAPLEATLNRFDALERDGRRALEEIDAGGNVVPFDALERLASTQFGLAARAAAHAVLLPRALAFVRDARVAVMRAARSWPVEQTDVHAAVYRVIYGGRAAIEEALVQTGSDALPALVHLEDVPSSSPSTEVAGVRVHSGDLLLSRGGAPTSALIARGNDFPGVFSHTAMVHVSETGQATVVESLIEAGAVLSTPQEYLESTKLRILLLRPRPEALATDALAPHRAATAMLERVRDEGAGYDFSMDWRDPERFFCSEVLYHAYRDVGIDLWAVKSAMSEPGLTAWLGSMGVRNFTTLVPSDLEYDPRLAAVAEWRDVATLRRHRLDNAVLDALLEGAGGGDRLSYAWYLLPPARLLKAWSLTQWAFGGVPAIPEGMTASTALRADALSNRIHPVLLAATDAKAARFAERNGYEAPYWTLVELARDALAEERARLAPALRRS